MRNSACSVISKVLDKVKVLKYTTLPCDVHIAIETIIAGQGMDRGEKKEGGKGGERERERGRERGRERERERKRERE